MQRNTDRSIQQLQTSNKKNFYLKNEQILSAAEVIMKNEKNKRSFAHNKTQKKIVAKEDKEMPKFCRARLDNTSKAFQSQKLWRELAKVLRARPPGRICPKLCKTETWTYLIYVLQSKALGTDSFQV